MSHCVEDEDMEVPSRSGLYVQCVSVRVPFFLSVSSQFPGDHGACLHIFLVQAVAFSLWLNQGLLTGGHLQNGRLFTGFVNASLSTVASSGATLSDIL